MHSPAREFSLAELVSAINELQRRQMAQEDAADEGARGSDSQMSSGQRLGDYDSGRELTE